MSSLQSALPLELANNVIRLYRECLRRAKYIGNEQYSTELLVDMVRQNFRRNMHETDPEKIQKLKDDAASKRDLLITCYTSQKGYLVVSSATAKLCLDCIEDYDQFDGFNLMIFRLSSL